jgi:hypothetical protein
MALKLLSKQHVVSIITHREYNLKSITWLISHRRVWLKKKKIFYKPLSTFQGIQSNYSRSILSYVTYLPLTGIPIIYLRICFVLQRSYSGFLFYTTILFIYDYVDHLRHWSNEHMLFIQLFYLYVFFIVNILCELSFVNVNILCELSFVNVIILCELSFVHVIILCELSFVHVIILC